jgi:hypothetical protein
MSRLTRSKLRRIIREESRKVRGQRRINESISKRQLKEMVDKAHNMLQKARIQGTNDIRNFIDPQTTPDPSKVEGLRNQSMVVDAVVEADEAIVRAINALYELKNQLR